MNDWKSVCPASDIPEGAPLPVESGDKRIALYKIAGKIYATGDICPHQFAHLSGGNLDGYEIECPLHQATFDVRNGRCTNALYKRLQTFDVEIRDGQAFVDLAGRSK
jgi:naphthalene 1,2-dioxygenase ferredoxin component